MSLFTAMAAGYLGELNNMAKEKAEAKREEELRTEDFQRQKDLATFQNRLSQENWLKQWEKESGQRTAQSQRQAFYSADDAVQAAIIKDASPEYLKFLFGEGANADLIKAANLMSDAADSFGYGAVTFNKPNDRWDINMASTDMRVVADTWLGFFSGEFANAETAKKTISDLEAAGQLDRFVEDVNKYTDYYVQGQLARPDVDKSLLTSYYRPKDAFGTLYQALQDNNVSLDVDTVENSRLKEDAVSRGEIDNPNNAFVFKFVNPTTNETVNETYEFSDIEMSSVSRIANASGYGDNIQGFINDFGDVARAETGEEAYSLLLDALEFEKMNVAAFNQTAAGTTQQRIDLGTKLQEKYGDDPYPAVQAIAVLMVTDEERKAQTSKRKGRTVKLAPSEDYFTRNGLNKSQIGLQFDASEETLRQLNELERLLTDDKTPTGLKAAAMKVGFGIFGTGGQLDQWFGSSGNDQNLDQGGDGVPATTIDSLTKTAVDGGFISATSAKNLSEIDALKLTLAAQMARAVDPSGRLSNQDFEVQLKRLGQTGLFTSKIQAEASLGVVIEDFKNQRRRLVILNDVASAESFGIREARILKADRIVRQARAAAYAGVTPGTSTAKPDAPTAPPGLTFAPVPIAPGLFTATDQDGTIYYSTDKDGKDIIDESAAMDMVDQAMKGGSNT